MSRYPKKLFYKIGEVCEICGVEAHVLRYWESEFAVLAPTRNKSGQRIYRQKDLDVIDAIKRLLYQEGYTIAGAGRQLLEQGIPNGHDFPLFRKRKMSPAEMLEDIKENLEDLLQLIDRGYVRAEKRAAETQAETESKTETRGTGPATAKLSSSSPSPGTQLVMSEVLLTDTPVDPPQASQPEKKLTLKLSGLTTEK